MKKVESRQFEMAKDREGKPVIQSVYELARACLYDMPQGGFTLSIQHKRMRVMGALDLAEKSKSAIELEDADYETLKECVNGMAWGVLSRGCIDFTDHINAAAENKGKK